MVHAAVPFLKWNASKLLLQYRPLVKGSDDQVSICVFMLVPLRTPQLMSSRRNRLFIASVFFQIDFHSSRTPFIKETILIKHGTASCCRVDLNKNHKNGAPQEFRSTAYRQLALRQPSAVRPSLRVTRNRERGVPWSTLLPLRWVALLR